MSKYLVNSIEVDLENPDVSVSLLHDRLVVRSAEGSYSAVAIRDGGKTWVSFRGNVYEVQKASLAQGVATTQATGDAIAPMPGLVVDIKVKVGDVVKRGDKLLVLEAMKTQQPVTAPFDGTVEAIHVDVGEQVAEGILLLRVNPA